MGTFKVSAGAKGAAGSRYNADTQAGFFVQPIPDIVQLGVTGHIDAVELLGSVERHQQYIWGWVGEDCEACLRGFVGELRGPINGRHDDGRIRSGGLDYI